MHWIVTVRRCTLLIKIQLPFRISTSFCFLKGQCRQALCGGNSGVEVCRNHKLFTNLLSVIGVNWIYCRLSPLQMELQKKTLSRSSCMWIYLMESPRSGVSYAICTRVTMYNPLSEQACISTLNIPFIPSFNKWHPEDETGTSPCWHLWNIDW